MAITTTAPDMKPEDNVKATYFKAPINWPASIIFIIVNFIGLYGLYLSITGRSDVKTPLFFIPSFILSGFFFMVGCHRYYSHKNFEANLMTRLIFLFGCNFAAQLSVYQWTRWHRAHHKWTDTDADPVTINRGIIFSHCGWVMLKQTKEFQEKVKALDLSDLESDSYLMFQYKYFYLLVALHWFVAVLIPCFFWNETFLSSFCTLILGFLIATNISSLINSLTHGWGWKPYDTKIESTFARFNNYVTFGSGHHNFHHVFPKDYSESELKWSQEFNPCALFIDMLEYIGWVKKKKVTNPALIQKRRLRTGDKTVQMVPVWNVLIDYILGIITLLSFLWLVLAFRFAHANFYLS